MGTTYWIDVCPTDGNLVATCDSDKNIKIYDARESKLIDTLDRIHLGEKRMQFIGCICDSMITVRLLLCYF